MVFGNMGEGCATGVAFTRDPATGERVFYGEYLPNAQGEDVVSGVRTPHPINRAQKKPGDAPSLEETMPDIYRELDSIREKLERHYTDTQDIEFTIQRGKLWMLQTRTGKRTAQAAVRIAVEMEQEGLIDRKTAVLRVDPEQVEQLLHKRLDPATKYEALTKGLPASPGAAVGRVVFTAEDAVRWAEAEAEAAEKDKEGHRTILVREETSPEDIDGMNAAQGFLTARGGMTSHAAVVARGMGKCCVAGASDDQDRLRVEDVLGREDRREGRRLADPERLHRRGRARQGTDRGPGDVGELRDAHDVGRRVPPARGDAPTRTRRTTRRWRGGSEPRASACVAPSTCSSARSASSTSAP